jgi:glycosyltransferase involved in cell wall biosynthesis
MKKQSFLDRYFKPWTLPWLFQRSILVVKQRRLPQVSLNNLVTDYRFTREVRKKVKSSKGKGKSEVDVFDLPFFRYHSFELPSLITCQYVPDQELSALNRFFDHIYVINLERRPDRRLEMIRKLSALAIRAEFFRAEDGSTEENIQEYKAYLEKPIEPGKAHELEIRLKRKVIYSHGSWAYLKTYSRLLRDAQKRGFERILCLDDDVIFARDFEERFSKVAKTLPETWKLLYLGASQHSWKEGEDLEFPGKETHYYYPLRTDGSFAIGIRREIFEHLQKEVSGMNCSFDSGALRSASLKYRGECFVLYPNLVIADVRESDIMVARNQESHSKTVKWELKDFDLSAEKELVSVIITAFNAEKTLERSLRSVMMQSYKDLEIIVVDDGSTDGTAGIVERLAREDPRIVLIAGGPNIGAYPARNLAICRSRGRYITFQDADDIALKDRIRHQLIYHSLENIRFSVMRILRSRLDFSGTSLEKQDDLILKVLENRGDSTAVLHEYRDQPNIGLVTSMFDRVLFEELGLFWENRFGADAEIIERILYHKTGLLLKGPGQKIHAYLSGRDSIPGLYRRIDTVGIISPEMTDQNLTRKFPTAERDAFEDRWRKKLTGDFNYDYPEL